MLLHLGLPMVGPVSTGPAPSQFVTAASDATDVTAGNSWTFAGITFPAGRIVLGLFGQGAATSSPGTVTINGVTATLRHTANTGTANNVMNIYDADQAGGTGSVTVQWLTATGSRAGIGVWGVGARSFISGLNNSSPTDPSLVLSQNTNAGDTLIAIGWDDAAGVTFSATGLTQNFDGYVESNHRFSGGFNGNCTGGAPETFILDSSGTGNLGVSAVYRL
jgi:hypothetical protein